MYQPEFITSTVIQLLRDMKRVGSDLTPLQDFLKINKVGFLNLRDQGLTIQNIQNLCSVLKENNTVTALDLGLNRIGDKGALCLQSLLEANTPLVSLNLERNPLCVAGAQLLAEGLKKNSTLEVLNLRQTQICSGGAEYIAAALCINTTLRDLNLALNGISKRTGAYFAQALKENTSLMHLNFEDNQLNCEGIEPLVQVCIDNQTLTMLHLGANSIQDKGADTLLKVVNTIVEHTILRPFVVYVNTNSISAEILVLLKDALAKNKAKIESIKPMLAQYLTTATLCSIVTEYLGAEEAPSLNAQRGVKRLRA